VSENIKEGLVESAQNE